MKGVLKLRRIVFFFCVGMVLCFQGLAAGVDAGDEREDPTKSQYTIGPEDQIDVSVWGDETLTRQAVVRPDGRISLPLIGEITAQGLTVGELQQQIEEKFKVYIPRARVTVTITEVNSSKVYVIGKVTTPGVYTMGRPLRVMQALALAGGLIEFADKDDILIIREDDGRQKVFEFDYGKVSKGENMEQNVFLRPGDTIVVP
jgi:polysaccharide export outer membrane protein